MSKDEGEGRGGKDRTISFDFKSKLIVNAIKIARLFSFF